MKQAVCVAVIVPVYNVVEYLPRCLDSILAQTHTALSIIVVDDGSTDGSGAMADNYATRDSRLKVIHRTHAGVAAARNTGVASVTEPYLTFVDADDYVTPDYVATLLKALQTNGTPMAMVGLRRLDEQWRAYTVDQHGQSVMTTREVLATMMQADDPLTIAVYAKLYATSLFKDVQFPVGHTSEDVAVMYQLLSQCPQIAVDLTPQYFYCYRQQSTSQQMANFAAVVTDDIFYHQQLVAAVTKTYPELRPLGERWLLMIHLLQWVRGRGKANRQIRKELWHYIKTHRKTVLRQKDLPRKQALLLRATYLGQLVFIILWRARRWARKRHNM